MSDLIFKCFIDKFVMRILEGLLEGLIKDNIQQPFSLLLWLTFLVQEIHWKRLIGRSSQKVYITTIERQQLLCDLLQTKPA